jgi:hypothetical protein
MNRFSLSASKRMADLGNSTRSNRNKPVNQSLRYAYVLIAKQQQIRGCQEGHMDILKPEKFGIVCQADHLICPSATYKRTHFTFSNYCGWKMKHAACEIITDSQTHGITS